MRCSKYSIGLYNKVAVMNYEEREIQKLNKQLLAKEDEHRRELTKLTQKIELLQAEVLEYQEKEMKNRQLNDSIMMSYKQNESYREQFAQKEITTISAKHQEELKKAKQKETDNRKKYEEEVNSLKAENEKMKIESERVSLEFEKKIAEVRNEYEEKLKQQESNLSNDWQHKLDFINERHRQTDEMLQFYKEQLEKRTNRITHSPHCQGQDYNMLRQNYQDENSHHFQVARRNQDHKIGAVNQQAISALNMRINRALTQLNPQKAKLQERIRQIKQKQY